MAFRPPEAPREKASWLSGRVVLGRKHFILLGIIAVLLLALFIAENVQVRNLRAELRETVARTDEVLDQLAEKEREWAFAQTDAYIEQQARERFGYIFDGEIRFEPQGDMAGNESE